MAAHGKHPSSPSSRIGQRRRASDSRHGRPSGRITRRYLRDLFAHDPTRGERLTAEAVGLYLDYSKNRITDETLLLTLKEAEEAVR
jgi:hypothetical protein